MVMNKNSLPEKRLAQLLNDYYSDSLNAMAAEWFGKKRPKGKGPVIEALVKILCDTAKVKEKIEHFSEPEMACLSYAKNQKNPTALSVSLCAMRNGFHDSNIAIFNLFKKGLILASSSFGGNLLRINKDMAAEDRGIMLLPSGLEFIKTPASKTFNLTEVSDDNVENRKISPLVNFFEKLLKLAQLTKEKKIRLKNDGMVGAAQWKLFFKEIEGVKLTEWKHSSKLLPSKDVEILPLPFIFDMARISGIIVPCDELLRPGPLYQKLIKFRQADIIKNIFHSLQDRGGWADDTPSGKPENVLNFFLDPDYNAPKPLDITCARYLLAGLLGRMRNRGWIPLEKFIDLAVEIDNRILFHSERDSYSYHNRQSGPKNDYDLAHQREFIRCFIALTCFRIGVVDIGTIGKVRRPYIFGRPIESTFHDTYKNTRYSWNDKENNKLKWTPEDSKLAFRFTALGREVLFGEKERKKTRPPSLMVGADFEILADKQETDPETIMELSLLCNARKGHASDSVVRFRIERASVMTALQSGRSIDEIITFFKQNTKRAIPGNVLRSLHDWGKGFGRLSLFLDRDIAEFESEKQRDGFLKNNKTASAVGSLFALIPKIKIETPKIHIIDYDCPPVRCLTVSNEGVVHITRGNSDLLVDGELERYAARDKKHNNIYRLNKKTVFSSSMQGRQIVENLKERSKTRIPKDISLSIFGWKETVSPLEAETLLVLKVDNPSVLAGIMARVSIRECFTGMLADNLIVVHDHCYKEMKLELKKMGIGLQEKIEAYPVKPKQ